MRHRNIRTRLSRPEGHRNSLITNLVRSLVLHERIETTLNYAKVSKRYADKMITLAKKGSVEARRQAYRLLKDRDIIKKLFHEIGPKFANRAGGYTRLIRIRKRAGDNAQLVILEFVGTIPKKKESQEAPLQEQSKAVSAEQSKAQTEKKSSS